MNIAQKLAHFVFPAPCSNGNSSDALRTDLPPNQVNNNSEPFARCEFRFSDGRQCRQQSASFCVHHAAKKQGRSREEDLPDGALAELVEQCADLTTATNINRAVAHTYLLLAQGRISQKQAVAFGYLSQLLLQTVPGIRAEHVSAFGYSSWESRLKESLEPTQPTPTEPTPPPNGNNSSPLILSEPGSTTHAGFACVVVRESGPDGERRISPNPANQKTSPTSSPQPSAPPANKIKAEQKPIHDRILHPHFGDLLRRGRALMDRKYDMTPEGRHEAKALALELELMNPAPAKPRRDRFGQVVDLVRRIRDHQHVAPGLSPASWARPASDTPPSAAQDASGSNVAPSSPPAAPASSEPPPRRFDALPSPLEPVRQEPVRPAQGGHATDWYAPASWLQLSPCGQHPRRDPFPSRQEKWKRELRSISNFRSRQVQHQNQSRAFWR